MTNPLRSLHNTGNATWSLLFISISFLHRVHICTCLSSFSMSSIMLDSKRFRIYSASVPLIQEAVNLPAPDWQPISYLSLSLPSVNISPCTLMPTECQLFFHAVYAYLNIRFLVFYTGIVHIKRAVVVGVERDVFVLKVQTGHFNRNK